MSAATVPVTRILVIELLHADESLYSSASKSMKAEGRAMLLSIAADLSDWPNSEVTVASVTDGIEDLSILSKCITRHICQNVASLVDELLTSDKFFDAVFCIAPEGDGVLQATIDCLKPVAERMICVGDQLMQLGGDKLAFHDWCQTNQIPTIPVLRSSDDETWPLSEADFVVVKNRFGAGCEGIHRYRWGPETQAAVSASDDRTTIWQPFVNGLFYSVGIIGRGTISEPTVLPAVLQKMHWNDDSPAYLGGQIPAELTREQQRKLAERIQQMIELVKFDDGYVGIDLVWCDENYSEQPHQKGALTGCDWSGSEGSGSAGATAVAGSGEINGEWLLVEMNPRLCTSYLGYRKLFPENLAELWWNSQLKLSAFNSQKTLSFDARAF
ncbi:MAG: ATP-grasp domain-containing protein [Fuerstiella sp.]